MLLKCVIVLCCISSLCSTEISAIAVIEAVEAITPVNVSLYYETLCPDCRYFVLHQLLPAYINSSELMNLTLVPYGNAETKETSRGYEFICQHGPKECVANKIHACAVNIGMDKVLLVKYIACMIYNDQHPDTAAKKCGRIFGIPWVPILQCSRGPQGSGLLKGNGDATKALGSQYTGVPTVTLNGEFGNQSAIINNFWGEVCELFPDPKPQKCLHTGYVSDRVSL